MRLSLLIAACLMAVTSTASAADLSAEQLAKIAQNPLANLISVPVQSNTNFGVGPQKATQEIVNLQPVVPFTLNDHWNLLTRTVLPLISQPGFAPGQPTRTGIGDAQLSLFLSPSQPSASGLIWGAGMVVQAPTDTHDLGNRNWGAGPTFAVIRLKPGGPWVYGVLVNNVTAMTSDRRGGRYNNFLLQPIVNYNLPGGTYINSVPIITANWEARHGQQWTVPVGMGIGHVFHIGKAPINAQIGGYYNAIRPDGAARWQTRVQVQLMFPK